MSIRLSANASPIGVCGTATTRMIATGHRPPATISSGTAASTGGEPRNAAQWVALCRTRSDDASSRRPGHTAGARYWWRRASPSSRRCANGSKASSTVPSQPCTAASRQDGDRLPRYRPTRCPLRGSPHRCESDRPGEGLGPVTVPRVGCVVVDPTARRDGGNEHQGKARGCHTDDAARDQRQQVLVVHEEVLGRDERAQPRVRPVRSSPSGWATRDHVWRRRSEDTTRGERGATTTGCIDGR